MGKTGRSDKKVKSERLNALRKQYDTFLEDDRKRKERNEYILGRLDKMRTSDKSVLRYRDPISAKVDHPMLLNSPPCRHDSELLPFRRNYSVVPPLRTVDELDLLRVISKNYILIPKRDQRPDDQAEFTPQNVTPVQDNSWKSKYDILNELKKREKESNDLVGLSTPINDLDKNCEFDAEYITVSKQNYQGSINDESLVASIDPDIPERDTTNNQVEKSGIAKQYSTCKDILKPVEELSVKVIDDNSEAYSDQHCEAPTINNFDNANHIVIHETFQDPFSNSLAPTEQEVLVRSSQNMRRPQAHHESDTVKDGVLEGNAPEELEANEMEITKSVNFVDSSDQTGAGNSKEIINQEYPLFEEDPDNTINVADISNFTPSEVAHVQRDAIQHSSNDATVVTENIVQEESYQEQPKYTAITEHISKHDQEIVLNKENEQTLYTQEIKEQHQEFDQPSTSDNSNVAQVDNMYNYDQGAQEVACDENVHNVNYEHNVDYDPNIQDVNYDQHTTLGQDEVLNYEQIPEGHTYDQTAKNADYNQDEYDGTYEGDGQQNHTVDQNYTHTENYTEQSEPAGEVYDQNYPVDGVYQPDASYVSEQPFDQGTDQNYANVHNQSIVYDHDITQQQYDQAYAEQYSTEPQPEVSYDQPQQYDQEYEQVYDQYQQGLPETVEEVQKQLDKEDGYLEEGLTTEAIQKEAVPEEVAPVTTA